MKIKQYQEVYKLLTQDMDDVKKMCVYYTITHNLDYDYVYNNIAQRDLIKNYKKFKSIKQSPIFSWYRIGWKFYRTKLDVLNNTAEDNISIQSLCANENEIIENAHKVMSIMTRRKDKSAAYYEKLAERIKDNVDMSKAYALAVFFFKLYNDIENRTMIDLTKNLKKVTTKLRGKLHMNG